MKKYSKPHFLYILVARHPLPLKRDLGPRNSFLPFSQKIQLFLKKLLNNKIFSTSFVIKKVMLIFGVRRLLSLKNCHRCSQNSFSRFSQKIVFFPKKNCWIIKYSPSKFWLKRLYWFLVQDDALQVAQWPSVRVANKVRFPLLPRYKISLFLRTSCARHFLFLLLKADFGWKTICYNCRH